MDNLEGYSEGDVIDYGPVYRTKIDQGSGKGEILGYGPVTPIPRQVFEIAYTAVRKNAGTDSTSAQLILRAHEMIADIQRIANNEEIYFEGRDAQIRIAVERMQNHFKDALSALEVNHIVTEAQAIVDAMPRLPEGETLTGRFDARMILDGASATSIPNTLAQLAGRGDAIGAIVTDQAWLSTYLSSREDIPETLRANALALVQNKALEAAASSNDTLRRNAVSRLENVRGKIKGRVAAHSYVRYAIGQAKGIRAPRSTRPPVPSRYPSPR